jgi:hypothetical protein
MWAIGHHTGKVCTIFTSGTNAGDDRLEMGLALEYGLGIEGIFPLNVGRLSDFHTILSYP